MDFFFRNILKFIINLHNENVMSLVTNGVYARPSNGITHEGGSPYVLKIVFSIFMTLNLIFYISVH